MTLHDDQMIDPKKLEEYDNNHKDPATMDKSELLRLVYQQAGDKFELEKEVEINKIALDTVLNSITNFKGICCLKNKCPNFEYCEDGGGCKYEYKNNDKCLTKYEAKEYLLNNSKEQIK